MPGYNGGSCLGHAIPPTSQMCEVCDDADEKVFVYGGWDGSGVEAQFPRFWAPGAP